MNYFITYIFLKGQTYGFVSCHPLPLNYVHSVNKILFESSLSCMKSTVCCGMSFVKAKSKADFKRYLFTTLLLRCETADFLHCFPTFPLLSSNLPTLFACPPPPIVGLSHADQKNFRATSKYPASNAGRGSRARPCLH